MSQIHLTDLFNENGYLETGWFQVDGSPAQWFEADPNQFPSPATNGEKWLDVNAWADGISFWAPGRLGDQGHEYSVAGLSVPIPEPSSMLLFGAGALVVSSAIKRRRRNPD